MTKNSLQHVNNCDELALLCWENEGGSLLGGAHLRCNENSSASAAGDNGRKLDVPPVGRLADRRAMPRRSTPENWIWTRGHSSNSHRFARRWLPRVLEKRRSRHVLERTPLGLLG
jgi:hypothetical protein